MNQLIKYQIIKSHLENGNKVAYFNPEMNSISNENINIIENYLLQQNADKEQIDHITGKDVKTWK